MEGTRAMPQFDAIVIGTGQAGPSLARRLVAAGRKVAVIERKHFGGTCVNTGCTPTKALVASAYAAHTARRHADYGVTIGGPIAVDMKAVKARKDAIVAPSRNGVERSLKSLDGCTVYQGHGRFVSPTEVQVGETVLSAPQIFINVGGRASGAADARPRSGGVSDQLHHGGPRRAARASDRRRRQLYRARIRAGLPALRHRKSP